MLWVTTGLKSYVVLGMGLFVGGMYVAARYFRQVHLRFELLARIRGALRIKACTQSANSPRAGTRSPAEG